MAREWGLAGYTEVKVLGSGGFGEVVAARHDASGTAEAALVVLQGSLLGLAAAHRRGVVHRDYKPENVLIDGAGASKLTDFGIAARAGQAAVAAGHAWALSLTPMWMRDAGVAAGDEVTVELAPEGLPPLDRFHHPAAGPARGAHRRGRGPARGRDQAAPAIMTHACVSCGGGLPT